MRAMDSLGSPLQPLFPIRAPDLGLINQWSSLELAFPGSYRLTNSSSEALLKQCSRFARGGSAAEHRPCGTATKSR